MSVTVDDQILAYEDGKKGCAFKVAADAQVRRQLAREPNGPRVLSTQSESILMAAWERGDHQRHKDSLRGSKR